MSEWQPIETAPKDRRILLSIDCSVGFCGGNWDEDKYRKKPRPYWRADVENWMGILWMRDHQPTHWMDIQVFRELMGLNGEDRSEDKYRDFKDLNKCVIKPALSEVNKAESFAVTVHFKRENKKVVAAAA